MLVVWPQCCLQTLCTFKLWHKWQKWECTSRYARPVGSSCFQLPCGHALLRAAGWSTALQASTPALHGRGQSRGTWLSAARLKGCTHESQRQAHRPPQDMLELVDGRGCTYLIWRHASITEHNMASGQNAAAQHCVRKLPWFLIHPAGFQPCALLGSSRWRRQVRVRGFGLGWGWFGTAALGLGHSSGRKAACSSPVATCNFILSPS